MDKEQIRRWIEENLVMQDKARMITGQSVSAFNQSVTTGKIKPFVEFGESRKTRLYHINDLESYASSKRIERRIKELFTVIVDDGGLNPAISITTSSEMDAIEKAKRLVNEYPDDKVFIEFFRSSDDQQGYLNPDGYGITGSSWSDD